jgi:hypothetical protein
VSVIRRPGIRPDPQARSGSSTSLGVNIRLIGFTTAHCTCRSEQRLTILVSKRSAFVKERLTEHKPVQDVVGVPEVSASLH